MLFPVQRPHLGDAICRLMLEVSAIIQRANRFFSLMKQACCFGIIKVLQVILKTIYILTHGISWQQTKVGLQLAQMWGYVTVGKPDGLVATLANAALSQVWQFYEVYDRDVKMTHILSMESFMLPCNHSEMIAGEETYSGFLYCQFCQM